MTTDRQKRRVTRGAVIAGGAATMFGAASHVEGSFETILLVGGGITIGVAAILLASVYLN